LPQDIFAIFERVFKGLFGIIKSVKINKELTEIGLNEVYDRLQVILYLSIIVTVSFVLVNLIVILSHC